jgi:hypothetical protein
MPADETCVEAAYWLPIAVQEAMPPPGEQDEEAAS